MPPKASVSTVDDRVRFHRQKLIDSTKSVYIGDPAANDLLTWANDDEGGSYVVKKDNGNTPIRLSLIARITRKDTFLVPDGNYTGPSEYTKTFSDLKLSIALGRVSETENEVLAKDFDNAYALLSNLRVSNAHDDSAVLGVLMAGATANQRKLKLRHKVFAPFEETESDDVADANDLESNESPGIPNDTQYLRIENYLVKSNEAIAELADMINNKTHILLPLPAFEQLKGDKQPRQLIPFQYSRHLEGALVVVEFFLTHTFIAKHNKDTFSADVFTILVIDPPVSNARFSPQKLLAKRKLGAYPVDEPATRTKAKGADGPVAGSSKATPTKPYVFTIVIKVDNLHSNLLPDGGYTKPSSITPSLSDARITVAGCRPSIEPFKSDFDLALSRLDAILDKKRNPGIGWKASGLTFNDCGDFYGIDRKTLTSITAGDHVQSNNLENQSYDMYYDKYKVWSTAGWPIYNARAAQEREHMVNTRSHEVCPLPLKTFLSSPDDYKTVLAGRHVIAKFAILHATDTVWKVDFFDGVIEALDPIEPTPDDIWRRYF
ncbi:hypothetical protein C8R42DRAFT_777359 [Lentinula raphanica]|nr:hypothetical protein C8R42DRAFT_777359 [Lentinula raphanica]